MIKEIDFKKDNRNEYIYDSIAIDTPIKDPGALGIELLKETEYLHEILTNTQINITTKIPNADWIPTDTWPGIVCVSKKFKNVFENTLKGYWYPINNENYFIFLLNNCIYGLDEEKTEIINRNDRIYQYESIEHEVFKSEVEEYEYIFTLLQTPLTTLCTHKFEDLYRQNNLKGIQFYKDISFNRKDIKTADFFRFKSYDDEGNCLS